MYAISSSLALQTNPASAARRRRVVAPVTRRLTVRCGAFGWDHGGGEMVDESMIVLRKRIHDMKVAERNYKPPAEWSEWEKKYYTTYAADVCELLGLMQWLLLSTRPAVAAGVFAVVTLSVPTSAVYVVQLLLNVVRS